MSKIKLITQTHKERQWQKVDAGFVDKLKHFATFGASGRIEWVDYEERDITMFIPLMDERFSSHARLPDIGIDNYRPFFSSPYALGHPNCRCKITKL